MADKKPEEVYIDWPEVNRRLPIHQDPKSRADRKALFKQVLGKGNKKAASLDDLKKGIKNELRFDMAAPLITGIKAPELNKALTFAFKASSELAPTKPAAKAKAKANANSKVDTGIAKATSTKSLNNQDKAAKATVDRREFHAFLVSFKYYLELAELFENMDGAFTDDQKLSCRECLRGKDKLAEWGLSEELVKERFKEVDVWIPLLKFDEFVDWVMAFRWEHITLGLDDSDDEEVQYLRLKSDIHKEVDLPFQDLGHESDLNKMKLKEVFAKWDTDNSGGLDEEEMATLISTLNPALTKDLARRLFDVADANKDGVIDYDEFINYLFGS
jgi:hypothetical protein